MRNDLLEVLRIGLQHALGSGNSGDVSESLLGRELRLSFGVECFHDTSLYRDIMEWQNANLPYKVLAV